MPEQPMTDATPQATELARQALKAYAEHFGGIHEDDCPCDDTCDCSGKAINDGVTLAVNLLDRIETLEQALLQYGKHKPGCACQWRAATGSSAIGPCDCGLDAALKGTP